MSDDWEEGRPDADMAAYYEEERREHTMQRAVINIIEAHEQRYALAHKRNVYAATYAYVFGVWEWDEADMALSFNCDSGWPPQDHWFADALMENGLESYVDRPWRMDNVGSFGGIEECLVKGYAPGHLTLYRVEEPVGYRCGGESEEWDVDYPCEVIAHIPVPPRPARYRMRKAIADFKAWRREKLKRCRRLFRARMARPDCLRIRIDYGMDNIFAVLESSAVERAERPALGHKKRRWMPHPTTCVLVRVDGEQHNTTREQIVEGLREEAAKVLPHWGRTVLDAVQLHKGW